MEAALKKGVKKGSAKVSSGWPDSRWPWLWLRVMGGVLDKH